MKSIYILSVRLRNLWVLLPMIFLLYLSIIFNNSVEVPMKLYPLIIFSIACIIFTFIYMFRAIEISYSEIKYIGRFSSRDSATIIAGRTLVLDILEKGKLGIKLYGKEGYNPDIKWLQSDDDDASDICTFRGKSYRNEADACKILTYFGVDENDFTTILDTDGFVKSYENVTVSTLTENEHRQIRIYMDKTV